MVNQAPDVNLACDLACLSKESLVESMLDQRMRMLEKMGQAKDKLEIQMELDGQKITEKLQIRKKNQKKLL